MMKKNLLVATIVTLSITSIVALDQPSMMSDPQQTQALQGVKGWSSRSREQALLKLLAFIKEKSQEGRLADAASQVAKVKEILARDYPVLDFLVKNQKGRSISSYVRDHTLPVDVKKALEEAELNALEAELKSSR